MEQKENISFDDLLKLDIRICKINEVERVPKTDKLLKFTIDTGIDKRACVTNLGELFTPEYFQDKCMPFILNLNPTTIRGIESKAMVFIPSSNHFNIDHYESFKIGQTVFM